MVALVRIQEMLAQVSDPTRLFPATILYNEGWLLRLVLDWFSHQSTDSHPLSFLPLGQDGFRKLFSRLSSWPETEVTD
jgi:hypothetical protein